MKRALCLLAFATMFGCGEGESQSLNLTAGNTAVVLVDVQDDFTQAKSGSLGVGNADGRGAAQRTGDEYIGKVKEALQYLQEKKLYMVATQDFHSSGHISFASSHGKEPWKGEGGGPLFILHDGKGNVLTSSGKKPFGKAADPITYKSSKEADKAVSNNTGFVAQALWPDHCVNSQSGSQLVDKIAQFFPEGNRVKKGQHLNLESYSGFYEGFTDKDNSLKLNQKSTLHKKLQDKNIKNIIVFGLATDYCVAATAIDGVDFGYNVIFVNDLSEGVAGTSTKDECKAMTEKGIETMTFEELKNQIK